MGGLCLKHMTDENLKKFPSFLREGFREHKIDFFKETEWDYSPIEVYRMVLREKEDFSKVTRIDFTSFAENPRRGMENLVTKPDFYGVSTFTERESLVNKLKLPKPGKKIARGHLKEEYGPIYRKLPHICLWVYSDADFSDNDFEVSDYE